MELAYLYIEKFRNLRKVEFNLSSELQLHYDEENRVLHCENGKNVLPANFWGGNICNLTAIVGNNGAGKTSFMQYINLLSEYLVTGQELPDYGIIVLKDAEQIFYCEITQNQDDLKELEVENIEGFQLIRWLLENLKEKLASVKMFYLTNALTFTDYKRNQRMHCGRFNFLYDCSAGGLMYLNTELDINRRLRQNNNEISDLETYSIYEQYKQIKFVFDKKQFMILQELKNEGYPVPVPEKLYINLILDNQLRFLLDEEEQNRNLFDAADSKWFPKVNEEWAKSILLGKRNGKCVKLLQYQLSRCCIWGLLRSIIRIFNRKQKQLLWENLKNYIALRENVENDFSHMLNVIWEISESVVRKVPFQDSFAWENLCFVCKPYYSQFLEYIEFEDNWKEHIKIEGEAERLLGKTGVVHLSVSTQDAEWFIEFLRKYRYICNPDYFMDFSWGLSSGENNLLSTFASFYYIFDRDHTNKKNGEYTIYNCWDSKKLVSCDTVIIMADEVDLTYHPEWQREYVSLLTAFLVRVYPPSCCKNIQIILSTHSPILLGDIPQQNVIYLKTAPENGHTVVDASAHIPTFGQNIHLLLRDSFFLKKGTIGKYAHDKILKCFKGLQELEDEIDGVTEAERTDDITQKFRHELNEWEKYTILIAEPIIKKKLFMQIGRIQKKLELQFGQKEKNVTGELLSNLKELPDDVLEDRIRLLQMEKDRRKNDKDSNI